MGKHLNLERLETAYKQGARLTMYELLILEVNKIISYKEYKRLVVKG